MFARLRCLNHLVDRPITDGQESFASALGAIVDGPRFLKGQQVFVTAMARDEMRACHPSLHLRQVSRQKKVP
jgi:hypothetical protein